MKKFVSAKGLHDMLGSLLSADMSLENLHIAFRISDDDAPLLFPCSGDHHFVLVNEEGEQIYVDSSTKPEVKMNTIVFGVLDAEDLEDVPKTISE